MDWDKLRVFHAVAEAGSFTHAGDTLNLSQSAVSRQISALEEALQVPLFHRHARGLILTEQGESLNRTVREVFAKLAMTEALLTESKEKPAGRLKVTTTVGFGASLAGAARAGVPRQLPRRDDDADAGRRRPRPRDARGGRGDPHASAQAARPGAAAPDGDGMARLRLARITSRSTARRSKGEDLDNHRLVLFGDYRPPVPDINWLAEAGRRPGSPRRALLEVNSLQAMVMAVRSGLGIAALPDYMAAEEEAHGMVRLMPEREGAEGGRVFRLSGGAAHLQARGGVPRFPAGPSGAAIKSACCLDADTRAALLRNIPVLQRGQDKGGLRLSTRPLQRGGLPKRNPPYRVHRVSLRTCVQFD